MFYTSHLGGACAEARSTHGLSARESTQRSAMRTSYNALLTLTAHISAHQRTSHSMCAMCPMIRCRYSSTLSEAGNHRNQQLEDVGGCWRGFPSIACGTISNTRRVRRLEDSGRKNRAPSQSADIALRHISLTLQTT